MTNPSDIERVARAVCIADGNCANAAECQHANPCRSWESYRVVARAAIAAMPPRDWLPMRPMSEAPRDGTEVLLHVGIGVSCGSFDGDVWGADFLVDPLPCHMGPFGWWPLPSLGSPQTGGDPYPPHDKAQPDKAPVAPLSGLPWGNYPGGLVAWTKANPGAFNAWLGALPSRRSWVIAGAGLGSDADEAAYRDALARGDRQTLQCLDDEAAERIRVATKIVDEREGKHG